MPGPGAVEVRCGRVAMTLNNLGFCTATRTGWRRRGRRTRRRWRHVPPVGAANPDTYLPDVAMTLNNLGFCTATRTGWRRRGRRMRRLWGPPQVGARQSRHLPAPSLTLNNLGILHRAQNRMEEAGVWPWHRSAAPPPATSLPRSTTWEFCTATRTGWRRRERHTRRPWRLPPVGAPPIPTPTCPT